MVEPEQDAPDAERPRPRPPAARADAEPAPQPSARRSRRPRSRTRRRGLLLLALTAVLVAAVVAAAVLIVVRHVDDGDAPSSGPSAAADQAAAAVTRSDVANAFLAGATTDIVAVTTYDYRSLDTALSNGESVTTGAYRSAFRAALSGSLAREARRVHRVQTFTLLEAGIGTIGTDGSSAKVLIFGTQSVVDDTTGGKAQRTLVTLTATMRRQGNRYLVADLSAGVNAGLPDGTAGLRAAAEAGRQEVVAVLTLRHDHFDADYDKALAGAVEPLRSSLTRQSAATRRQITKGGYDLAGTVTAVAVERAAGDTLVLLVAATGTRTTGTGRPVVVVDGRYRVTVVNVSGRWATSAIDAVTAS